MFPLVKTDLKKELRIFEFSAWLEIVSVPIFSGWTPKSTLNSTLRHARSDIPPEHILDFVEDLPYEHWKYIVQMCFVEIIFICFAGAFEWFCILSRI